MSCRLVIRSQALDEIAEAADWYESHARDLSVAFLGVVDEVLAAVARNPLLHPAAHGGKRRALLRRFPYSLVYSCSDDEVVISACVHWRQDPRGWRTRP